MTSNISMTAANGFLVGTLMLIATQEVGADSPFELSGELTLATDCVFRGVSQTMAGPAIYGDLTLEFDSGLFGSVWASNVDFTPEGALGDGAEFEVDLLVGYGYEFSDRAYVSVNWVSYLYPNASPDIDYDYVEWIGSLIVDDRHSLSVAYSTNVFGSRASGTHYDVATRFSLPRDHWLGFSIGHYDLEDSYQASYQYGEVFAEGYVGATTWRIGLNATSNQAQAIFGERISRPRIVLALTTSF